MTVIPNGTKWSEESLKIIEYYLKSCILAQPKHPGRQKVMN